MREPEEASMKSRLILIIFKKNYRPKIFHIQSVSQEQLYNFVMRDLGSFQGEVEALSIFSQCRSTCIIILYM